MIWATVSSWSCFFWLYSGSPSLTAKNIINLILMLTTWWCPCVESSLVLLEEGVCVVDTNYRVLIYCTCHFWGGSLCLTSSVCWSLQCLISALTQGGGGGHFFRLNLFSPTVGREEHCKQVTLACAHSVSATLGLPLLPACVLSQSILLRL